MNLTTGTITATGAGSAISQSLDGYGPASMGVVSVSGTFTSAVIVVEKKLRGGAVWLPLAMINEKTMARTDGLAAPANSTTTSWRVDLGGAGTWRAYVSSGTPTSVVVELASGAVEEFGGILPATYQTISGAQTFAAGALIADSQTLKIGTDSDLTIGWDATDIDVLVAADDTLINFGDGTASPDIKFFGNTTGSFFYWDASADQLILNQGGTDTTLLNLRSSDVGTGLSTIVKGGTVGTTDYFTIAKHAAATGGAYLQALAESTVAVGLEINSWCGAPATTDTSASLGAMCFFVGQHDGSNADADMAADSNAIVWGEIDASNARLTRMLLKADDGELHLGNATLVALDHEDDVMLVRAMQKESSQGRGIVDSIYDRPNPFRDYERLRELKLVGEKDETGFHLFPLQPRLALHEGAIWQAYNDMLAIASVLSPEQRAQLPSKLQERLALPAD
jgi:hypothetical protein